MNKLPNEIINQILLFNSHPVADLFKEAVKTVNEELYQLNIGTYKYPGEDLTMTTPSQRAISMTFADHFFSGIGGMVNSMHIYHYGWMNDSYLATLSEYLRS